MRLRILALFALFLVTATVFGCGGGGKSTPHLASGHDPAPSVTGDTGGIDPNGNGLKRTITLEYDFSGFENHDGYTLVPVGTDRMPSAADASRYSLSVEKADGKDTLKVECHGAVRPMFHVRYDPDVKEVSAIGVPNPYGEGTDFVCFPHVPQPGLVEVLVMPAGNGIESPANGEVAVVEMLPKGTRRDLSTVPDGEQGYAAAIYCTGDTTPSLVSLGNIHIHHDGTMGTDTGKDGTLTGSELTNYQLDAYTHDVILASFGSAYGWVNSGGTYGLNAHARQQLSWRENLPGDYDNNGVVNINDVTPIGYLWCNPTTTHSKLIDQDYTGYANFLLMMTNPLYYQNQYHTNIDTFITAGRNVNHLNEDGVDGFWDGAVRDYYNWDNDTQNPGLEAYGHIPGMPGGAPNWSAPGDTLPIHYHIDEQIDGYTAWLVPTTDAGSFSPTSLPGTEVVLLDEDRDDYKLVNPSSQYDKILLSTYIETLDYDTDLLDQTNGGSFDIFIAPYAYVNPLDPDIKSYGPATHIEEVATFLPGTYGPQYMKLGQILPTGDATGCGLQVAKGYVDMVDGQEKLLMTFNYNHACNIDKWYRFDGASTNTIRYKLYVSTNENTLWTNPMVTREWDMNSTGEGQTPQDDGLTRQYITDFPATEGGINFTNIGNVIYFGIRLVDGSSNVIEYATPTGYTGVGPNTSVKMYEVVKVFGPQYSAYDPPTLGTLANMTYCGVDEYYGTEQVSFDEEAGLVELAFVYNLGGAVCDTGGGTLGWDINDLVEYRCYCDTNPATLFEDNNVIAYWYDDYSTGQRKWNLTLSNVTFGDTYYLGVRAFTRVNGAGPFIVIEYAGATQTPNTKYVTFTPSLPPKFVKPEEFSSADPPETHWMRWWYPTQDSITVCVNPAKPGPQFPSPGAPPVKYRLYYTTDESEFSKGVPATYVETSYLAFNTYFNTNGSEANPASPPEAAYKLTIPSLTAGTPYFILCRAIDSNGMESTNTNYYMDCATTKSMYPGQIRLAGGLTWSSASTCGSIERFGNDIVVLCPKNNDYPYIQRPTATIDNKADFSIWYLQNGRLDSSTNELLDNQIIPAPDYDALTQYFPAHDFQQTGLTYAVKANGEADRYPDTPAGEFTPLVSFEGSYVNQTQGFNPLTGNSSRLNVIEPVSDTEWLDTLMSVEYPNPGLINDPGDAIAANSMISYRYTDASNNVRGRYFNCWIDNYGVPTSSGADLNCVSQLGGNFWALPDDPSQPNDPRINVQLPLMLEPNGYYAAVDTPCCETVLRDLGHPSGFDDVIGPDGLPQNANFVYHNRLYCLAYGKTPDRFAPNCIKSVLKWSDTLGPTDWYSTDMLGVVAPWLLGPTANDPSTVNPMSLEVVTSDAYDQALAYVTFSNAPPNRWQYTGETDLGLRVACGTDTNSGPSGWTSPVDVNNTLGIIDTTYHYGFTMTVDPYGNEKGSYSVVDRAELRHNPFAASLTPFSGIGCAYIHPNCGLYLAESNTGNSTWVKRVVNPLDNSREIDRGVILWVKLAYNTDGTPFVLYARKSDGPANTYDIMLWSSSF